MAKASAKEILPGTRGSDTPHPVDVHVGQRIKLRRTLMGMTQGKLGEHISLTFQQIQKYERGANRVSASKLWQLGNVLDVPVNYFFEEMSEELKAQFPAWSGDNDETGDTEELTLHRRQSLELVRAFDPIKDPVIRKRSIDVLRAIAESETVNGYQQAAE